MGQYGFCNLWNVKIITAFSKLMSQQQHAVCDGFCQLAYPTSSLSPSWRWIMTLLLQRWPGPLYTERHTWRWEIHLSTYNNRRFPKPTLLLLITTDVTRPETSARQMRRDVAYEREPNLEILPTERRREIERQTAVNHVWTVTAAQLIRACRARHNPESS